MLEFTVIENTIKSNQEEGINSNIDPAIYIPGNVQRVYPFLNSLELSKDIECSALELGTYGGETALLWMELMLLSKIIKPLVTIDAHNIPGYKDYYITSMNKMGSKAYEMFVITDNPAIWRHYPVLDTLFMDYIYETLPFNFLKRYFFVNLDGPHDTESIIKEFDFFYDKIIPGGSIIIDDTGVQDPAGKYIKDFADSRGDSFAIIHNGVSVVKKEA